MMLTLQGKLPFPKRTMSKLSSISIFHLLTMWMYRATKEKSSSLGVLIEAVNSKAEFQI